LHPLTHLPTSAQAHVSQEKEKRAKLPNAFWASFSFIIHIATIKVVLIPSFSETWLALLRFGSGMGLFPAGLLQQCGSGARTMSPDGRQEMEVLQGCGRRSEVLRATHEPGTPSFKKACGRSAWPCRESHARGRGGLGHRSYCCWSHCQSASAASEELCGGCE
jgi:hypothetical protein